MSAVFEFLAENPILVLFLLLGVGMVFGHIKIRSISLGAAAVLFIAIALSAWANFYGIELKIPPLIGTLGLSLFAFAIGINSGPTFFHTIKTAIGPMIAMVAIFAGAAGIAWTLGKSFGMSSALIGGTFAGAVTNTPALAAAGIASGDESTATVGYSIAYLFGVIGMIIAAYAALSYAKRDKDVPSPLANRTIRVERDDHPSIGDITTRYGGRITFSRLRRGETGPISRPVATDILDRDDLVTVVGPKELVSRLITDLGHGSSHSLLQDRSFLDFRRITVSDPKLAGLTVDDLRLDKRFSATASRVRRGDIDMVAEPDLVLQQGDRVRVVAPTSKMEEITKFFGDSARGLSDINPIAMGLGMSAGILLGQVPIPTPAGEPFSIGAAAGTLIMGLIMGAIGRIGKIVTAMPYTACMVLSEFGLLVFLAQAGSSAGTQITKAFTSGEWWKIFLVGAAVTTFVAVALYVVMRFFFKMGGTRLSGLLGGAQTQPAVLAFANSRTNMDPRVALGYAMVYPMAMIAKILVARILGGL